jgi:glyoxylase-like metal-dependent hydrolase (beta-lactamase superfamily II)/rhodanese-related sulfurtransferase
MVQDVLAIRQFRQDDCLSYIVYDRSSLQAMVVDPRLDLMNEYRAFLGEIGGRVVYSIDTRLHADHLSGAHLFRSEVRAEPRCEHVMSSRTKSKKPSRKLSDGETLKLGAHSFRVLHAPGATEDGIILKSDQWLLTGDALWIGSSENAELPEADAVKIWESTQRLLPLLKESARDLLVYPGHDRLGILFSTLSVEKSRNPFFMAASPQALLEKLSEQRPTRYDQESIDRLRYNEAPVQNDAAELTHVRPGAFGSRRYQEYGASRINVEKFKKKLEEHAAGIEFIDVRERSEFEAGHMPGMRNVPLCDLGEEYSRLTAAKRVYISCLSGLRSVLAARTLGYLGLKDVVVVSGGFQAWNQAGFKVTEK